MAGRLTSSAAASASASGSGAALGSIGVSGMRGTHTPHPPFSSSSCLGVVAVPPAGVPFGAGLCSLTPCLDSQVAQPVAPSSPTRGAPASQKSLKAPALAPSPPTAQTVCSATAPAKLLMALWCIVRVRFRVRVRVRFNVNVISNVTSVF